MKEQVLCKLRQSGKNTEKSCYHFVAFRTCIQLFFPPFSTTRVYREINIRNINYRYIYTVNVAFNAILPRRPLHNYNPSWPGEPRLVYEIHRTAAPFLCTCSTPKLPSCSVAFQQSFVPASPSFLPDQLIKHAQRYIYLRHDSISIVSLHSFPGPLSLWPFNCASLFITIARSCFVFSVNAYSSWARVLRHRYGSTVSWLQDVKRRIYREHMFVPCQWKLAAVFSRAEQVTELFASPVSRCKRVPRLFSHQLFLA